MKKSEIISLIRACKFHNMTLDYLIAQIRPCISIKTQQVKETVVGASKIGGLPDLPQGMLWPEADGNLLAFIAQFRMSDISPFDESGMLPQAGMLYFFHDVDPFQPEHKVIFHPLEITQLIRQPFPELLPKNKRYNACEVKLTSEFSLPNYESVYFPFDSSTDEYWEDQSQVFDLIHRITPSLQHQLLGHANALQTGMETSQMEQLLFQVDEDRNAQLAWPGSGMLYYWIDETDLLSRNFDKTRVVLQTT
jgi:uncharacterized protein YwqG